MFIGIAFAVVLLASLAAYSAARRRALAAAGGRPQTLHSLPGYSGAYVALWTAVPACAFLFVLTVFSGRIEKTILSYQPVPAVAALPAERAELFYEDAQKVAGGQSVGAANYPGPLGPALQQTADQARLVDQLVRWGGIAVAAGLGLLGFGLTFPRIRAQFRSRNGVEAWTAVLLITCSSVAVLTTLGIVLSLLFESLRFFQTVNPIDFLTGTQWSPQIALRTDQVAAVGSFGAVPVFAGTFLIMLIAMLVAGPIGLYSAIYLAEYAGRRQRAWIKPALEILAGVPTVVYGFFAALTVGPLFRGFFNGLGAMLVGGPLDSLGQYLMTVQNQMALVAGAVMGIMIIPFISSLSDDILNSVPQSLRDGSYALGATPSETVRRVILPAALPGIMGAFLLAVSRAIGETMIVTMAAGLQPKITANPLDTVTTVTVQIVALLTGDQEFDSAKTLSAFGLGLTLFVMTLLLNIVALRIVQKYREQYD